MSQTIERKSEEIIRMLGPIKEVTVRMKMPAAFIEYINQKENVGLDEYCNEQVLQGMIAHLDNEEDIILENHYIIPAFLANYIHDVVSTILEGGNVN
jgi:hypothetical protein